MGRRQIAASFATLAVLLGTASAHQSSWTGTTGTDSFDDRMAMYTTWAKSNMDRGRRLSQYWGPSGAPPSPPPPPGTYGGAYPPPPPLPALPPGSSEGAPRPPLPPATPGPNGLIPEVVQPPGGYSCIWDQPTYVQYKVVAYWTGYANLTAVRNTVIPGTSNFLECQAKCTADSACKAWVRVAAGDSLNNRKCFLIDNLSALDPSPARTLDNHAGPNRDAAKFPELRYVDDSSPLLTESGTKDFYYPQDYYGCPYKATGHP